MQAADHPETDSLWPERLLSLCRELAQSPSPPDRDRIVSKLWLLANAAVSRYLRYHSQSSNVEPEDLRDIASDKSLAFIKRVTDPVWMAETTHPGQVCSYFSTLARNGLMDHFRSQRRVVQAAVVEMVQEAGGHFALQPEGRINRRQFAEALRDCTLALSPRARLVWFLRVMLEMSTREIAHHPRVQMNATSVDMMLSRARRAVRECMKQKGFDPQEIPSGTLALLWGLVRNELEEGETTD